MVKANKLFVLSLTSLFVLVGCNEGGGSVSSEDTVDTTSSSSNSVSSQTYEAPVQTDETQIYQKRAFPTLTRGMTFYVEDYIGVVPGRLEDQEDTSFKTYVVENSYEAMVGAVSGGDGTSNEILLYRPGLLVFNISANDVTKTFSVEIEESNDFSAMYEAISVYSNNYIAEQITYDDDGNEIIANKIYRSKNYIYNETQQTGYILTSLNDNIFSFTLSSSTSTDLEVNNIPQGDKSDYHSMMGSFTSFQTEGAWSYSALFSSTPSLKKYKYLFYYSQSVATKLFYGLGLMNSSYTSGGTKFYPYFIFASYTDGALELLPVMIDSAGSNYTYFYPFRLSSPDQVKVSSLDNYVSEYLEPESVDVEPICEAFYACSKTANQMNYTMTTTTTIVDDDGVALPSNSTLLSSSSFFRPWNRSPGKRIATQEAYYGETFHGTGSSSSPYIPGGYWSSGGKTYTYTYDKTSDKWYATKEVIEYGETEPYEHWYSYSTLAYYIPTLAISMTSIRNSYPTYDEETGYYTFLPTTSSSLAVMTSVIKMTYRQDVVTGGSKTFKEILTNKSELNIKLTYKEDKTTIDSIELIVTMPLEKEDFSGLTKDYHFTLKAVIDNIGSSDLSHITSQLTIPEEN